MMKVKTPPADMPSRPAPRPRTKPAEVRLDELMAAAERLFLAQGVEATTINEIVEAAQVAKGTFYHYFTSKNDMLDALGKRYTGQFLASVEAHFLAHWSVAQYAQHLGLSTAHLNRLVRAASGRGAQAMVHERLTREACRRLLYVAAPAASLAWELGFNDPAYFSRFFKRQTGMSPQKWREAQQFSHHSGANSSTGESEKAQ